MTEQLGSDPFRLAAQLSGKNLPPVHQWNPDYCGDIDLRITRSGVWIYENSPINRQRLVKLLSSVLRLDEDGEYYLVTPVEKLRVHVDDAPFVAVELEVHGRETGQRLLLRTNVDEVVIVDRIHPIRVEEDRISGEPSPYLMIRDGLEALISRPVFYQLADLAIAYHQNQEKVMGVWSCGDFFFLGKTS